MDWGPKIGDCEQAMKVMAWVDVLQGLSFILILLICLHTIRSRPGPEV